MYRAVNTLCLGYKSKSVYAVQRRNNHCPDIHKKKHTHKYSRTPLIRTLFFRISNYPDRLGPSVKFVENSTKLTCLEITGYRIKYSTALWLVELQIRRDRKVYTQVPTVNNNSRDSNCQWGLFSKKSQIIRIFWISGWFAVPINTDK